MGYIFLFLSIILNVSINVMMKYIVSVQKPVFFPLNFADTLNYLLNPWLIGCFIAMVGSVVCWAIALSKFELSYAYPFTALSYAIVLVISGVVFHESISLVKIFGTLLVTAGVILIARG